MTDTAGGHLRPRKDLFLIPHKIYDDERDIRYIYVDVGLNGRILFSSPMLELREKDAEAAAVEADMALISLVAAIKEKLNIAEEDVVWVE